MSKSYLRLFVGFGVASIALATSAHAQTLSVYFALQSDSTGSTPITATNIGAVNSTLALSVWMKSSSTFNALAGESFFSFDNTTSTDPNNAVLTKKKIGLLGDSLSALTPSGVFGINNGVYYDIDNHVSPSYFGIAYDFGASGGTAVNVATTRKLYDVTLYNKALAAGSTYTVRLVNNGTTQEFQNNFLVDGNGAKISGGSNLVITASSVPEPATMAIFGFGLIPFLRKRKSKSA